MRVGVDVFDHHALIGLADLVADGCLDGELAAWLQAKVDLVANGARNPSPFSHSGDGGKAHSGRTAHHLENPRHDADRLDRGDVVKGLLFHCPLTLAVN